MTRAIVKLMFVLLLVVPLVAQSPADVRRLYEAGKYREVVEAAQTVDEEGAARARVLYLAGQSYQKLDEIDKARSAYGRLADAGEEDPWRDIGRAALALLGKKTDMALETASSAVSLGPKLPEAHYQLGLAYSYKEDFAKAAASFEKAAQLDPAFGYAYYYAGLSFYKTKRIDLMAVHFEQFLKVAPDAPERPQVESIMRTVRGR